MVKLTQWCVCCVPKAVILDHGTEGTEVQYHCLRDTAHTPMGQFPHTKLTLFSTELYTTLPLVVIIPIFCHYTVYNAVRANYRYSQCSIQI